MVNKPSANTGEPCSIPGSASFAGKGAPLVAQMVKNLNLNINLAIFSSVQFSSVAQSCPTLYDPMNCSRPGLPVHHQLLEFTKTHVHRVSDATQPSHPVVPFSSCPQSLPASESFPMSQLFTSGGQSIGVSALASFLPMNTQD